MTLEVEHRKHFTLSELQDAQAFCSTMKEDAKHHTSWAAFYNTSRTSWYPPSETTVNLLDLTYQFKNVVTGPRRTELQFARVLKGSRQLWPNMEHYLIICTNTFLHQMKRSASQTAAKIVDTDHKNNSDKRDLYSDKNDNARISEMKMRISLFPL